MAPMAWPAKRRLLVLGFLGLALAIACLAIRNYALERWFALCPVPPPDLRAHWPGDCHSVLRQLVPLLDLAQLPLLLVAAMCCRNVLTEPISRLFLSLLPKTDSR
jgi:hypothetical protein